MERYIVEELLGCKLSHCIGGLTTDPIKRAGWIFALNEIHASTLVTRSGVFRFDGAAQGVPHDGPQAKMRERDGLHLDDVAFAAIPPAKAYQVLLVGDDVAEQEPFVAALDSLGELIDRFSASEDP